MWQSVLDDDTTLLRKVNCLTLLNFPHVILILTRIYLSNMIKICIKSTRAIAQLVEHLVYTRANVFFSIGVHHVIKRVDLIEKSMSYSRNKIREQ